MLKLMMILLVGSFEDDGLVSGSEDDGLVSGSEDDGLVSGAALNRFCSYCQLLVSLSLTSNICAMLVFDIKIDLQIS